MILFQDFIFPSEYLFPIQTVFMIRPNIVVLTDLR